MRLNKTILAVTIFLASHAASAQTKYLGGVDVGSKGTKGALFSVTQKGEENEIKPIFGKAIVGRLVSSMQNGRFTSVGIKDATDATKELIEQMQAEAKKRKIVQVEYYVVGSSGVALGQNKDELAKAMKEVTHIDMEFIDAKREGYFGLTSSVPIRRRTTSMYIDIGSGNTKIGCLVGGSDLKSFKPVEIPFGSVSGRKAGAELNPADIPAGIDQLMKDKIGPAYTKESMDTPCLSNRQRIYWTGGAAWATATLMHPDKVLDPYAVITGRDVDAFLARLRDRSWNQKKLSYAFPKDMETGTQNKIRAQAEKDRDDVMNTFVREDLLSGVSIMKTVLDISNPSAVVVFARESGFIYGYGLEKYMEQKDRESVGTK